MVHLRCAIASYQHDHATFGRAMHGLYSGVTQLSLNTHSEAKRARYATETYQKGTVRHLPDPNSAVNPAISLQRVDIAGY